MENRIKYWQELPEKDDKCFLSSSTCLILYYKKCGKINFMKPIVSFDDFIKLDLRVGTIIECVEKEESDKLLRLTVDFGEEGTRNILSGIKKWYKPEDLKGKQFIFIINLEPRKI